MEQQCEITLRGKTFADVITQAETLVTEARRFQAPTTTTTATTKLKKTKALAAQVEETEDDDTLDMSETDDATTDETELSFDDTTDDEEEIVEPTPKKKTTKITDKDINAAAMAHAKKHGRPKTMKILNDKFKVKSILELKADKYPEVLKALKV